MRARYRPRPKVGQEIPVSVLGVESRDMTLWIASEPLPAERFPYCIRNILARAGPFPGRHRALATLAAFLGQAGWTEKEARRLWNEAASMSEVSEKIFDSWYRKLHCPKCDTIRKKSKGYPNLGLEGLGYCDPVERCREFSSPVESAAGEVLGSSRVVKTSCLARVFDWGSGKEGYVELTDDESAELQSLMESRGEGSMVLTGFRDGARIRPKFILKGESRPRRMVLSELF
jgi:hypothetical protein